MPSHPPWLSWGSYSPSPQMLAGMWDAAAAGRAELRPFGQLSPAGAGGWEPLSTILVLFGISAPFLSPFWRGAVC